MLVFLYLPDKLKLLSFVLTSAFFKSPLPLESQNIDELREITVL